MSTLGKHALDVLELIIRPTLSALGMGGADAETLMVRTGLAESRLTYIAQFGEGPALSWWQVEPATHDDNWENFIRYRPPLKDKISKATGYGLVNSIPPSNLLGINPAYACAMARIKYYRAVGAIPPASDVEAQGEYWKEHYNTPLGAGTVEHFLKVCEEAGI